MTSPFRLLASLAFSALAVAPASAANFTPPVEAVALNVALGCQIEQQKVLAITNTTGAPIPAATRIEYRYDRSPDHSVILGHLSGGQISAGQVIRKGIVPAYSCKAWFRKALVLKR